MTNPRLCRTASYAIFVALTLPAASHAREFRVSMLPNGHVFQCANCHISPGGGGTRNAFGRAVEAITGSSSRQFWSPTLAAADSDGDGFTNGSETGDPDGDGAPDRTTGITNPGNSSSKPANAAPTVSIGSPADGSVFIAPAATAIEATATDTDGTIAKVEFFTGDQLLGVVTEPPYTLLVDWAVGNHAVSARATDNLGASTTSPAVNMTIHAPAAPRITRVVLNGAALEIEWVDGGGPFGVEVRTNLASPWQPIGNLTTGRTASIEASAPSGILRIADFVAGGPGLAFTATLSGAAERPEPVDSTGSATATFSLQGSTLTFEIQYSGLSGAATGAHIHGPAGPEASADVMINLAPFNGGSFGTSGTVSGSVVLTPEQKAALVGGMTYVNFHTPDHPAGEIRGQLLRSTSP